MQAARLHGPKDLRVDDIPRPQAPGPGQVLLRVTAVGVCGSDLHNYEDARIGDTIIQSPVILGHEFAGVIEAVGADARDGLDQPLQVGQRVAVDPAMPCYRCEMCERGHPNLCSRLHFHGLFPDDGAGERDQAEESYQIGQHAGRDEQGARDQDDDAVERLLGRQAALLDPLVEAPPGVEPFPTGQVTAGNAGGHDEPDRRPEADELVHLDQQAELHEREDHEQGEESEEHDPNITPWGMPLAPDTGNGAIARTVTGRG